MRGVWKARCAAANAATTKVEGPANMKPNIKMLIIAGTFLTATSGVASATTNIAASTGHEVWNYANESCMRSTWANGGIKNLCGTTQAWQVQLPVTNTGTKTIVVSGWAGVLQMTCSAMTVDQYGNAISQSNTGTFSSTTGANMTQTLTVNVAQSTYTLELYCDIGANDTLYSIRYNM
jgi:hypothetical protein